MNKTKGFTLIELLVVIAIIGILSSVVLASLNTARGKGADAAIKSSLNNMRAQAENIYDSAGGTYASVCSDATVLNAIAAMKSASGAASTGLSGTAVSATAVACHATSTSAWAMASPLKTVTGVYACVDGTGFSGTTTVLSANSAICGL